MVAGKRMEDHLRFAVCYWHLRLAGRRPVWRPDVRAAMVRRHDGTGRLKADVAFEMFSLLKAPYFCFHDFDVRPEGANFAEKAARTSKRSPTISPDKNGSHRRQAVVGHGQSVFAPRFMSGAATNPDPDVFAYRGGDSESLHGCDPQALGGENYVLWGGREGYETLLNTDLARGLDQMGRFLNLVVEYKHKIGFEGTILIEPKPQEPTKHQYDYDVATVYGFLKRYGLENEVGSISSRVMRSLPVIPSSTNWRLAQALGIFGSIDMNRNDYQSGWDTDQFPNNVPEMALAYYAILKGGGFSTGGTNFDAKLRRQSIDPEDLLYAHIGGMDTCARALKAAARMVEDGVLTSFVEERYAGWNGAEAQKMLDGGFSLSEIEEWVRKADINPQPKSGRQEYLENVVNRYV
jgi:xylose isomerase